MSKVIHSVWRRVVGLVLIMLGMSSAAFYYIQMHVIAQSLAATSAVVTYTMPSHSPALQESMAPVASSSPRASSGTQTIHKVKLGTATQADLEQLPRIGPKIAQSILAYREQHGFKSVEELTKIKGIGPKTLAQLKPYLEL